MIKLTHPKKGKGKTWGNMNKVLNEKINSRKLKSYKGGKIGVSPSYKQNLTLKNTKLKYKKHSFLNKF